MPNMQRIDHGIAGYSDCRGFHGPSSGGGGSYRYTNERRRCDFCDGSGRVSFSTECSDCDGEGKVKVNIAIYQMSLQAMGINFKSLFRSNSRYCYVCGGCGVQMEKCPECNDSENEDTITMINIHQNRLSLLSTEETNVLQISRRSISAVVKSGRYSESIGMSESSEFRYCGFGCHEGLVLKHCYACDGFRECCRCDGDGKISESRECSICHGEGYRMVLGGPVYSGSSGGGCIVL